jgi:hypothetical protein
VKVILAMYLLLRGLDKIHCRELRLE